MKTYIDNGETIIFENTYTPKSLTNSSYQQFLEELKNEEAELVPYIEPAPTWEQIKAQRDRLLIQSDWTTLSDATPKPNKEAWLTYRQALRDITKTYSSPESVVWPTDPLGVSPVQLNITETKIEQEPTLQAILNKLEEEKQNAEQEKLRQEELQRQEEERLKQEELQRQKELEEQERLRQEEQKRIEEERRQRQEAEQQRQREEEQKKQEELQRLEDEKNRILEELQQIDQQLNT